MRQTTCWLFVLVGAAAACGGSNDSPMTGAAGTSATASPTTMLPAAGSAGMRPSTPTTSTGPAPTMPVSNDKGTSGTPPITMTMMQPSAAGSASVPPTTGAAGMNAVDPASCPAAPAGTSDGAVMALSYLNSLRLPAGAGCVKMVAEINKAAENHCNYYADPANDGMCTDNPHNEVMGCAGFTGTGPGQRMAAAGYMARGGGEVMAFVNNPKGAIDTWVNSVWHRIPLLDPWTSDMGYGSAAAGCDTIDFGNSAMGVPATTVLVYPYDGQTDVPTSFNGMYEGPTPPAPPSGWPSASPITLYARMLKVTEHVLTKDGDSTPIEHTWLEGSDPMWGSYLRTSVFLYAHTPFEANTKYRMSMKGTSQAGPLDKQWTFTTGAAAPNWGGGRMRP